MNLYIFLLLTDRNPNIFKVGRSSDIVQRLRNYNVGRINEIELKYFALVRNSLLIEKCIKFALDKNKEIFKVEPHILKKIIDECYCKNVSKKQNMILYEEISNLLGLYTYTKDKVHINPYIIIGKNL